MKRLIYPLAAIMAVAFVTMHGCNSSDRNVSAGIADSLIVNNGLVAFYDFEENVKDHSGYGHNGILWTGIYQEELYGNTTMTFPENSYVEILNDSILNPVNAITIAAWVRPVEYYGSGYDPIVVKAFTSHENPYWQYILGMAGNRGLAPYNFAFNVCIDGINTGINTGANAWVPGKWYHVAGVFDGRMLRLYVNGNLKNSLSAPGKISTFNTNLFIAYSPNIELTTPVTLDNIRIYNRALNQKEINQIYTSLAK